MKKTFKLVGLDCANCAAKIEEQVKNLSGVKSVNVNFVTTKMVIEADEIKMPDIITLATAIVKKLEPDVLVKDMQMKNIHININRNRIVNIIVAIMIFAFAITIEFNSPLVKVGLFLISYLVVGKDVIIKAGKNILRGQIFDENFLMSVATIGAFIIGEYPEGVVVMLFYQVGELFQSYAVNKSRKSIASLMDIRPDYANIKRDGKTEKVAPDMVMVGDIIVIKPGEKVPLDAVVTEGNTMIDTSALTGESVPREIFMGDEILSGCINRSGVIEAKVTKEYGESTVSKILELVENASSKKSSSENFITKFARYYTPAVVIIATLVALIPPLLIPNEEFTIWVYRALTFLVISCPCALVISVPLSFFGGIGAASKKGILVKGSNYLEALAKTEVVVFDKTGTLTKGVFKVQKINPKGILSEDLIELTAYAESYSNHPISISLKAEYGKEIDNTRIADVEELAGYGVIATVDGKTVAVGNSKMVQKFGLKESDTIEDIGTIIHIIVDKSYCGYIVISDEIRKDAYEAVASLKQSNIKIAMLTGDAKNIGEKVAKTLLIDTVYGELLPADKVDKIEELLTQKTEKGKLIFVGDGINDAPVLARADVGIAMGGIGSDAAIEAADIVIMTDEPTKISTAIQISKKTLQIVYQNIGFALGIKFLVLILGVFGFATMWVAVFADVGVSVLAVMNAIRILNVKRYK